MTHFVFVVKMLNNVLKDFGVTVFVRVVLLWRITGDSSIVVGDIDVVVGIEDRCILP